MDKPTKVEVGQRWKTPGGQRFTIRPGMTSAIVQHCTLLGWDAGYGPQQGAGPEAGKALSPSLDRLRGLFAAGLISERTFHDETAKLHKPAPEVAPLPSTPNFPPHAGEMRDAMTGVAMTALEAIRSRKPPAPWVPSVDEWDLLPDV